MVEMAFLTYGGDSAFLTYGWRWRLGPMVGIAAMTYSGDRVADLWWSGRVVTALNIGLRGCVFESRCIRNLFFFFFCNGKRQPTSSSA